MLDYGVLNGNNNQGGNPPESPDAVYISGPADLTDFVAADLIYWWDTANIGVWDRNEDIYMDVDDSATYDVGTDFLIYVGTAVDIADNDAGTEISTSSTQYVMYLDSDHDNVYDVWYDPGAGTGQYSGMEEPLILVSAEKSTGDSLTSADEVLEGYDQLIFWHVDNNRWYDYDCSECHYNNPPVQGNGTYGTSLHVDGIANVIFDTTANGIASYRGVNATPAQAAGAWNSGTLECYGIYCHSDGFFRDFNSTGTTNYYPDFAGTGAYDDDWDYHTVRPQWDDYSRSTVYCGACHNGWDKPADAADALDKPATGAHRKVAQHAKADQFTWHKVGNKLEDAIPCEECHWRYDTYNTANENPFWKPYGSYQHLDGYIWRAPGSQTDGIFGPLAESQGYEAGGCHNTWIDGWTGGGYPGAC
jgi:hypothetical protein